ncbi:MULTISPECIES: hypothetical protein [unclassified Variovorax]|uniref:hypothetical protein n=1 Tax=unclassified Variovorax TaxID=663243 RepID=UPI0034E968A9
MNKSFKRMWSELFGDLVAGSEIFSLSRKSSGSQKSAGANEQVAPSRKHRRCDFCHVNTR